MPRIINVNLALEFVADTSWVALTDPKGKNGFKFANTQEFIDKINEMAKKENKTVNAAVCFVEFLMDNKDKIAGIGFYNADISQEKQMQYVNFLKEK